MMIKQIQQWHQIILKFHPYFQVSHGQVKAYYWWNYLVTRCQPFGTEAVLQSVDLAAATLNFHWVCRKCLTHSSVHSRSRKFVALLDRWQQSMASFRRASICRKQKRRQRQSMRVVTAKWHSSRPLVEGEEKWVPMFNRSHTMLSTCWYKNFLIRVSIDSSLSQAGHLQLLDIFWRARLDAKLGTSSDCKNTYRLVNGFANSKFANPIGCNLCCGYNTLLIYEEGLHFSWTWPAGFCP